VHETNPSQVVIMIKKNTRIWIWLQDNKVLKAVLNVDEGTMSIYDENDNLILRRTGLTIHKVKEIEINLVRYGAKRLSEHQEPFKFL